MQPTWFVCLAVLNILPTYGKTIESSLQIHALHFVLSILPVTAVLQTVVLHMTKSAAFESKYFLESNMDLKKKTLGKTEEIHFCHKFRSNLLSTEVFES